MLVDNRGSGRSAAAGSFSVADMAGDTLAVLDHAGIAAAHVLGASLGGMIVQELAVRNPERVGRLILACTTPGWPLAYPMPLPSVRLIAASQRLAPDEAVRRHIENALSPSAVADRPELVQQIIDCQSSISACDGEAWQAQAAAGGRYAGSFRQRHIRARTLILHGTADRVVDPRNARLVDRIEHSRLVTFAGLGHFVLLGGSRRLRRGGDLLPARGRGVRDTARDHTSPARRARSRDASISAQAAALFTQLAVSTSLPGSSAL